MTALNGSWRAFLRRRLPAPLLDGLKRARAAYRGRYFTRISARLKTRFSAVEWATIGATRLTTFPEYVYEDFTFVPWKLLKVARIKLLPFSPWKKFDVCINFQDNTFSAIDLAAYIREAYARTKVPEPGVRINFDINDISKKRVGELFCAVFGYELNVDPRSFTGLAVEKNNLNAAHDGKVMQCPIDAAAYDERMSYTLLVDNTDGEEVLDLRLPIIKTATDFCYLKRRPLTDRFSNTNRAVTIGRTGDFFNSAELEKVERFCRQIQLEYGELDCVRDKVTRRLYILDVNKTPSGPPNGLPKDGQRHAIEEMAYAFCRNFILDHAHENCAAQERNGLDAIMR